MLPPLLLLCLIEAAATLLLPCPTQHGVLVTLLSSCVAAPPSSTPLPTTTTPWLSLEDEKSMGERPDSLTRTKTITAVFRLVWRVSYNISCSLFLPLLFARLSCDYHVPKQRPKATTTCTSITHVVPWFLNRLIIKGRRMKTWTKLLIPVGPRRPRSSQQQHQSFEAR